jgi:hypothetical protein
MQPYTINFLASLGFDSLSLYLHHTHNLLQYVVSILPTSSDFVIIEMRMDFFRAVNVQELNASQRNEHI